MNGIPKDSREFKAAVGSIWDQLRTESRALADELEGAIGDLDQRIRPQKDPRSTLILELGHQFLKLIEDGRGGTVVDEPQILDVLERLRGLETAKPSGPTPTSPDRPISREE